MSIFEALKAKQNKEHTFASKVGSRRTTLTYRVDGFVYTREVYVPSQSLNQWVWFCHSLNETRYQEPLSPREVRNHLKTLQTYRFVNLGDGRGLAASESDKVPQFPITIEGIEQFGKFRQVNIAKVGTRYEALNLVRQRASKYADALLNSDLQFSGLTPFEKRAYEILETEEKERQEYLEQLERENRLREAEEARQALLQTTEGLITFELGQAGATYVTHRSMNGGLFHVTYTVNGDTFYTVVDQEMRVQAGGAGICVAGYDRNYTLFSIIPVIREGQRRGLIYRTGRA